MFKSPIATASRNMGTASSQGVQTVVATDGDILVAKEMQNLTIEERTKVYEDVHGVADAPILPTDPHFLQRCLSAMDEKLRNTRVKKTYDLAAFLFPRYTKGAELRFVFLRAVNYNPIVAAKRLVYFFKVKLRLFGSALLGREITFGDLSAECQHAVRTGCYQFFPLNVKDRSGRPIFCQFTNLFELIPNHEEILRSFFYTVMAGLREMSDLEQVRGVAAVIQTFNCQNGLSSSIWELLVSGMDVAKALPIKLSAFHLHYDTLRWQPAASLVQMTVSKFARLRLRTYCSSFLESKYHLNTFGISSDAFAVRDDCSTDTARLEIFISGRLQHEIMHNYAETGVEVPTVVDVLLGRGKSYQAHPGNINFLAIVDRFRSQYEGGGKAEKRRIVDQVNSIIISQGGRFLRIADSGDDWDLMSESEAFRKIRNAFRTKAS